MWVTFFATCLGCEAYAISNIFYSIIGPLQTLVVLHGVHDDLGLLIWTDGPSFNISLN